LKQRLSGQQAGDQLSGNGEAAEGKDLEDEVTPWDVKASSDSGVDYEKLILRSVP